MSLPYFPSTCSYLLPLSTSSSFSYPSYLFFLTSTFLFSFAASSSNFFFFLSFFAHCSLSLYSLLPCSPFLNLLPSNFSVFTSFLHFILISIHLFTYYFLFSPSSAFLSSTLSLSL